MKEARRRPLAVDAADKLVPAPKPSVPKLLVVNDCAVAVLALY
jgi:hypothetical protein